MGRSPLEVFKFAVYLSVPVGLTYIATQSPEHLNRIIANVRARARPRARARQLQLLRARRGVAQRSYVVYPEAGPLPPADAKAMRAAAAAASSKK